MRPNGLSLTWLEPGQAFPPLEQALGQDAFAPGLLAAGDLSVDSLRRAYSACIFPWFSANQPILWWSTDPRMVLQVAQFRLHRSLRKVLQRFVDAAPRCELRFDSAFEQVIRHCAGSERDGQAGTWILPEMVDAYCALHRAGQAHSVETWVDGQLVGGLYCVALGRAVFGESMFSLATDSSKIALAALVAFCRAQGIAMVDCQQNTRHLASLGAREMPRAEFVAHVAQARELPPVRWRFEPVYWQQLLAPGHATQHDGAAAVL